MTKKTKSSIPKFSTYTAFAPHVHPDYALTLPVIYQRVKRKTFPPFMRAEGKRTNPALWSNQDLIDHYAALYGLQYPESVKAMAAVLGVRPSKKKASAK